MRKFVSRGGRLVMLNQRGWEWKQLADFRLRREVSSRGFPHARTGRRAGASSTLAET